MDLAVVWYILVTVLFTGYFILEGFDFGVAMLLPFVGKDDTSRRVMLNTIGPHWDGNEVWIITAGGAIFAAFPHWYATLFSGFYLPLFLMLVALIFRGVAFEFRSKNQMPAWRNFWDWALCLGSFIPALLWGVAFANLARGVPIDETMTYTGGFFNLLNPFALVAGVTMVLLFVFHGALFLQLKVEGPVHAASRKTAQSVWMLVFVLTALLAILAVFQTDIIGGLQIVLVLACLLCLFLAGWYNRADKPGRGFVFGILTILLLVATYFSGMFPRLMVSSTDPALSLTIMNSASGPMTLKLMTIVAAIFVPIVLLYQGWSYWVFRNRIKPDAEHLEY